MADLGAVSFSLYGVLVAIVLGSTSLYRELEHKTIFPILSRPIRRWEYLVGKYFGAVLTVVVFIAVEGAAVLAMLAARDRTGAVEGPALGLGAVAVLGDRLVAGADPGAHLRRHPLGGALMAVVAWLLATPSPGERQLVTASAVLALSEVAIVTAVATLFASFSSPFLTAAFTAHGLRHRPLGRHAGAHPAASLRLRRAARSAGASRASSRTSTSTSPPAPLLLGEVAGQPVWAYVGWAALHAVFYATLLLVARRTRVPAARLRVSPSGAPGDARSRRSSSRGLAVTTARELSTRRERGRRRRSRQPGATGLTPSPTRAPRPRRSCPGARGPNADFGVSRPSAATRRRAETNPRRGSPMRR